MGSTFTLSLFRKIGALPDLISLRLTDGIQTQSIYCGAAADSLHEPSVNLHFMRRASSFPFSCPKSICPP